MVVIHNQFILSRFGEFVFNKFPNATRILGCEALYGVLEKCCDMEYVLKVEEGENK